MENTSYLTITSLQWKKHEKKTIAKWACFRFVIHWHLSRNVVNPILPEKDDIYIYIHIFIYIYTYIYIYIYILKKTP